MARKQATPVIPSSDAPLDPTTMSAAGVTESGLDRGEQDGDVLNRKRHILVDMTGSGSYIATTAPEGWYFDRRITLKDVARVATDTPGVFVDAVVNINCEHVDEDANGVWRYRAM